MLTYTVCTWNFPALSFLHLFKADNRYHLLKCFWLVGKFLSDCKCWYCSAVFFMIVRLFYGRRGGSLKGQYQQKDTFEAYYIITVFSEKIFVRLLYEKFKSNLLIPLTETVNNFGNDFWLVGQHFLFSHWSAICNSGYHVIGWKEIPTPFCNLFSSNKDCTATITMQWTLNS